MTETNSLIGSKVRFNYPVEFVTLPDYSQHRNQTVEVIRQLGETDGVDVGPEFERMYEIRAEDGWIGQAFESELSPADT